MKKITLLILQFLKLIVEVGVEFLYLTTLFGESWMIGCIFFCIGYYQHMHYSFNDVLKFLHERCYTNRISICDDAFTDLFVLKWFDTWSINLNERWSCCLFNSLLVYIVNFIIVVTNFFLLILQDLRNFLDSPLINEGRKLVFLSFRGTMKVSWNLLLIELIRFYYFLSINNKVN